MAANSNKSLVILFLSILALPVNMTLSGIFLLALLIMTLVNRSPGKTPVPLFILKIGLLFIIFSLVQGIFALNPLFHYAGLIGHYLIYALVFWMLGKTVRSYADLKKLTVTVAFAGALASIIGILAYCCLQLNRQFFFVPLYGGDYLLNLKLGEYDMRASGFAMNPNNLACFLILTIFVTLVLFDDRSKLIPGIKNNFYAILLFLQVSCLILSGSRGGIIYLFTGFILYYFFRPGKYITLVTFLAGFVLIFSFNFGNYTRLLSTVTDPHFSSNEHRINVTKTAMEIIRDFPMGVGILNYENIYPYYKPANQKYLPHAHDWYIQTCIESGILGALIFFIFFFAMVVYIFAILEIKYAGIFLGLMIFSCFNITDYVLTDNRICILLTIMLFVGLKLAKLENEPAKGVGYDEDLFSRLR
jgi:O-antigen ligase